MSTYVEEKLARPAQSVDAVARRSIASLRQARGYRVEEGNSASPRLVSIQPMEERSFWARESTDGGAAAIYRRRDR